MGVYALKKEVGQIMGRRKTSSSSDKGNSNSGIIIVAVIGLVGTIAAAYFGFLASTKPLELTIYTTQTAEAKLTQTAIKAISATIENETKANKNIITGQIRWNDQPLEGINIVLFQGGCDENPYLLTITDSSGHYKFTNLEPGKYAIGVNGWAASEIDITRESDPLYSIKCSGHRFTLEDGKVAGEDFDLKKTDFVIISPSEAFVKEKPSFSWEKYPGASYYDVRIFKWEDARGSTIFVDRTIYTEHELSQSLEQGFKYSATITAYNANGTAIASKDIFMFQVTPN